MKHGTTTGYTYYRCRCDECRAAAAAYQRRWRARNPEKAREYSARWRAANPEKKRAAHAAYQRRWRARNPEKGRAAVARWHARNLDKVRAANIRKVGFMGKRVSPPANPRIGVCQCCGRQRQQGERQFHLHHMFYKVSDPLAGTMEVCPTHHRELHAWMREEGIVPHVVFA